MADNNYNSTSIVSMKFLTHLREKSGMYGFQLASRQSCKIQIKEIIDNATDEALDKNRIYPIDITFFVSKDKSTYQCLVRDHGRGIPPEKLVDCFTKEFTSGKYRPGSYVASVGTNGVGSKASAALSNLFIAFTKRSDGFGYLHLEKGEIKDQFITKKPIDKNQETVGTTVLLQPDTDLVVCAHEMFEKAKDGSLNGFEEFEQQLEFYSLFKSNVLLKVSVVDGLLSKPDLNKQPVELWRYLTNLDNFKTTVVFQSDLKMTPRRYVQDRFNLKDPIWDLGRITKDATGEDDPLGFDIDIFVDEKSAKGNNGFIGAINATPIVHPDSSHIAGLQEVLKSFIEDNIQSDNARLFFDEKYRIPISGSISASWQGAEFIGQDKTRFENRQFHNLYTHTLRKYLKKITEERGEGIWDSLFEAIREHFETEYAKFSRIALKTNRSMKGIGYGLNRPNSYDGCTEHDPQFTELFITEGDSAAGRVSSVRDASNQALLELSGKPINGIRNDGKKLRENAIFQDLCTLLGVSPADKDLSKMNFGKILIMTDADADGYHIVVLLFSIFYKINPLILEEGRVLVTCPPLYAMQCKKKTAYLRDEAALQDARITMYRTLFTIDASVDGGPIINTNKDHALFRDICIATQMIGDVVRHLSNLLNIDPLILEQLIHVVDYLGEKNVNTKKIVEILGLDDCRWDKANNVIVLVKLGMDTPIPLTNLQKSIREKILPIYQQFHWDHIELFFTTKFTDEYVNSPCTFMMLDHIFRLVSDPDKGVFKYRRFKGLGEMDEEAIYSTCVDRRTRSFWTIRGIGDINEFFTYLDVDTEGRKKLIDSGFLEA